MKTWQIEACRRAKRRGSDAYVNGKKLKDNPYLKNLHKPYGSPCLVTSWEDGWNGGRRVHEHVTREVNRGDTDQS